MKRQKFQIGVMLLLLVAMLLSAAVSQAQAETIPQLHVHRFQVASSGQYFELYNRGEAVDMSKVQLAYYNNYDLTKATSSKLISLSGYLAAESYHLVNDSALTLCYQTTVATASLGFSTTSGLVQVIYLSQEQPGGPFMSQVLDTVAWSKTAVAEPTDVQKLPVANPDSFLQRADDLYLL